MVTRRQQSSAKRGADAENASGIVEKFISKLAVALQGRGKRTWKVHFDILILDDILFCFSAFW